MNDDDRLVRLLREQVDARIADRHAPAFTARATGRDISPSGRRRPAWLLPLLAAACVCVLLGGTFGAVQLLSGPSRPAVQPTVSGTATSGAPTSGTPTFDPRSTPSTSAAPTTSASATRTSGSSSSSSSTNATSTRHSTPTTSTSTQSQTRSASTSAHHHHAAVPATSHGATGPTTIQAVVRPVTKAGDPVAGYSVTTDTDVTDCTAQSPVTVDSGVDWCGSFAQYTMACWHDTVHNSALCLRDARTTKLIRQPLAYAFVAKSAPAVPVPLDLTLENGVGCSLRGGGTGNNASDHPTWVDQYYCSDGTSLFGAVDATHGIDRSTPQWTVHAYAANGSGGGEVQFVKTAYFVGTA